MLLLLVLLVVTAPLAAQVNSRAEEIQQARRAKAANAAPEELSKAESRLNYIVDFERSKLTLSNTRAWRNPQ